MASTNPQTILIEVNDFNGERPVKEAKANIALTPGELLAWSADDELDPHGTADGVAFPIFCVENPYKDPGASAAIDTDYALGDTARYVIAQSGDLVYGFGKAGVTFAKGDAVTSDGAGAVQKPTIDATLLSGAIIGYADEDKVVGGGGRERLRVRVA